MNTANRRRAFTLSELLIVIAIFVLVLAIAVPAFSALLNSTERSQAENQVSVAIGQARAAALSTEDSGDTAAVFFYDPVSQRTRIAIFQQVGQIDDLDLNNAVVRRDVFVPMAAYQALQLPRGWMVRGFAPVSTVDVGGGQLARNFSGWYENISSANGARSHNGQTGNWVFPETGFYAHPLTDAAQGQAPGATAGINRQSFMVRFKAGTGAMSTSDRLPSLVFDPSPQTLFRATTLPWSTNRLDRAENTASAARRVLSTADAVISAIDKRLLLGDASIDTVLARPVAELAIYDENKLAGAIGARGVNAATGCLYGVAPGNRGRLLYPQEPALDQRLFQSFDAMAVANKINDWIQGSTGVTGASSDARLIAVDRYQGAAREVAP